MRKLNQTETYSLFLSNSQKQDIQLALTQKLNKSIGLISPEHIKTELTSLKLKSKSNNVSAPLISEALGYYEQFNGRVKLFNLGVTNNGRSPIPKYIPFISGLARNRVTEQDPNSSGTNPAIFVNMYGIGDWSSDESQYVQLNAVTDLYSQLETGVIAAKLLIENYAPEVFSNKVVLENLTKIYTGLFANIIIRTQTTFGVLDFNTDAARYLIAKFFLRYCLNKPQTDTVDEYAAKCIKHRSSILALRTFEESSNIDYDSLSGFLKTFGITFFSTEIQTNSFINNWIRSYGEATVLAIEYVPFLLHFLFSTLKGTMLGGGSKLILRSNDLKNDGLHRLYQAVTSILK